MGKGKQKKWRHSRPSPDTKILIKTLFRVLQCQHHAKNMGKSGTFRRTLERKGSELGKFLRPALMDEAFKDQYRGIINTFLEESLTLTGNHYKSQLDFLKHDLQILLVDITEEELQRATGTAVRWGHKNFKKKLSAETIQDFHNWLRAVCELSLSHDAGSQLMEHSSTPVGTRIGGAGDMTTSQATSTDTTDDMGEDLSETIFFTPRTGTPSPPLTKEGVTPTPLPGFDLSASMISEKMDNTPTCESDILDATITQSLPSSSNPGSPTQSAVLSSPHPGVSQQIQTSGTESLQAPTSDLIPTIHENQNEWQIPSLESKVVILGGSNLGMESKIETNWSSVECHSFPGAKPAHFKKMFVASRETPHMTPEHVILAESGAKTTKDLQVLEFEAQLVFPEAKIYFPKINTPFEPSHKNYSKFKKVNDAIDGLPYHHYILPKLPQWVDFSKRAITYSRKNYDGIKWKAGTADIVINHWLNHLEHPDNVATCSRTSCTCTGGLTTQS